jgi:hypothetical protein
MAKRSISSVANSTKKKVKWLQKFKEEYTKEFPFIKASRIDVFHAFCTVCVSDISVSHGGKNDIVKHRDTGAHTRATCASKTQSYVSSFFRTDEDLSVINAEVLFAGFLTEHNIPIAAADHAGRLFKAMFPDSKIAKRYSAGRTKTTAIIQEMSRSSTKQITEQLKKAAFSMSTDGSSDGNAVAAETLYPVVVRHANADNGKIQASLLSLPASKDSTGQGRQPLNNIYF